MSSPEETKQAADLIERLLTDAQFRAEFRRDPITACEQFGLTDLAEELRGGSGAKALYTLELRQSMSSLAGVIMAAAAEGIGALELAGFGSSPDKRVAGVVNEALSRHSIKAISQAQMQAVEQQDGQGSAAIGDDVPADDASVDAGCGACGDPTGVCGHTPGAGCPHCGDAAGSCGHSVAACSTCGDHAGGCGHGVACGACGEASGTCGHTPGKGCPSCGDASGECGHGAAACGVCGDGSRTCGHSHADRKQAAGLLHGHAHSHSGHGHAHGGGDGHGHAGNAHAGHAHAAQAPEPAKPQAHASPAPKQPAAPAAAEAPEGLHAASAAEAAPPPSGPASGARESGVFAGVAESSSAAGSTFDAMRAVDAEPAAAAQPVPAAPAPEQPVEQQAAASAAAAPLEVPVGEMAYPGDNAPKPQVAAWMAARAQAAGIPPELPVMAALVESRLSNVNFGDADSIGFFQMRTSIWDQGEYAGYGKDPEKQIKWFIDHAVHEKEKRVADGYTNFLEDPNKWGDWIADVERPAEEYRGRYQEQFEEAQALLKQAGGSAASPAEAADVAGAEAGHDHAGHDHGPSLADAGGPAVTPSAELAALLENPNLELPDAARADLASGRVDPRMVSMLSALTKEHKVGLSVIITGHDQYTSGGSVSNHFVGRGIDIASVDGEIVRANSIASREVAEAIAALPESIRPTEVGTPWSLNAPGFFTDGNHQDHLHIAYDDPAPAGFAPPASAAAPAAAAAAGAAAPAPEVAVEVPSRESGVFAGVAEAKASSSPTVGAMPAVEQPAAVGAVEAVAAPVAAVPGAAVAPVAPEDMANTNEGGKLHASEFHVQDAEGAPGAEGNLHAGYDLFAKAGAPVRSPIEGTIVEVKASRGNTGQIFGGTVKVQGADGRVWVFRHVDPKGVVEGGKVTAGQEIASVTEWTGGTHHAHIELWKTLEGGYNVSNMDDPYVELQTAYAGGGTELPPDVHTAEAGDEHAGHDHGSGGELAAEAGPVSTPSAELQSLLDNPKLELPDAARADLASGKVDPRLVSMLTSLTKEHSVKLSVIITGHDQFTSGGSVSNHFVGRGIDIAAVDGEIVRPNSIASRELAEAIADLPESIRPTEVGTPWSINAEGFFTDGNHQDHLHIAYDGEAPAGFASPVTPAAAPTPVAEAPVAAAPEPQPEPEVRESGVFAQVEEPAQGSNGGNTVQFMQAVNAEAKDKLQTAPEADLEPAKLDAPVEAAAAVDGYPGDQAPKEQLAAWMAARARAAGIPPELPVMAALVESRLSNVNFGDADSIGFFQMRTSIWDQGEYAGYGSDPEKQIKWFIDHAVHEKQKRLADGYTNFLEDETKWGDWVADIERPAEEYRGRYQERLAEARALLGKSGA